MRIGSKGIDATIDSGQGEWGLDQARYERLVSYCRWLSRNPDIAHDLANDALLEGWRNAHKLTDSAGIDRWLAAIARNVYLRWRRQAGRESHLVRMPEHLEIAATDDPAADYACQELRDDLVSALVSLPAATRTALLLRYRDDASYAEIAAQTNCSEAAVSMRLTRGRAQLRYALERDMLANQPASAPAGSQRGWQETRLWCSRCGQRQRQIRFDTENDVVSFRCPGCDDDPRAIASEMPLANPSIARMIAGLRQPAAISRRIEAWVNDYFRRALNGPTIACTACGAQATVIRTVRPAARDIYRNQIGMHIHCEHCGTICSSSLASLVMSLPDVRVFANAHGRVRTLPLRQLDAAGQPAVQMTIESVTGLARLDVLSGQDTFAVLGIHPSSRAVPGG